MVKDVPKKQISTTNKTFKNVYILTGDEKYLADYYSAQITQALVDEDMKVLGIITTDQISHLMS